MIRIIYHDDVSIEIYGHPQDFLSESDSEESDIVGAHELEDILTGLYINSIAITIILVLSLVTIGTCVL